MGEPELHRPPTSCFGDGRIWRRFMRGCCARRSTACRPKTSRRFWASASARNRKGQPFPVSDRSVTGGVKCFGGLSHGLLHADVENKGNNKSKLRERLPALGAHADQMPHRAATGRATSPSSPTPARPTPLDYRKPSISIRSLLMSSIWAYKMVRSSGETAKPNHIRGVGRGATVLTLPRAKSKN